MSNSESYNPLCIGVMLISWGLALGFLGWVVTTFSLGIIDLSAMIVIGVVAFIVGIVFLGICIFQPNAQAKKVRHPNHANRYIPAAVQREVWDRDGGVCINCDSEEDLEYDHVIPFSKGGSNTAANIQLLCRECNMRKSSTIGGEDLR